MLFSNLMSVTDRSAFKVKSLTAAVLLFLAFSAAQAASEEADWTDNEKNILRSLWIGSLGEPPRDPSNRVDQSATAAALGEKLFFDKNLSSDGSLACASCHEPERAFTDGRALAHGLGHVPRNAPSLVGAAYLPWLYWDGRRDSLWAQALTPFEALNEMGTTRTALVRHVLSTPDLRNAYTAAFGPIPEELADRIGFVEGGPFGSPEQKAAWDRANLEDRKSINQAFSNLGKAIAAFETTIRHSPSRFDRYVEAILANKRPAQSDALSTDEIAGLKLFIHEPRTRCLRCHNGPLFTNFDFHNVGTGTFSGPTLDYGRIFGLSAAQLDEFNCLGDFSDAPSRACEDLRFVGSSDHTGSVMGAFKVPGLRNVSHTGPYMHDGRFATLADVLQHYKEPEIQEGMSHELIGVNFSKEEMRQLEAFLLTLTDGALSD